MDVAYDAKTALVVVDVQNDFADPAGSLSVAGAEKVIEAVNAEIAAARAAGAEVVYTQDWHPPHTPHFVTDGGPWPPHCVAGTPGADAADGLELPDGTMIVEKADTPAMDVYSPFPGTGFADDLRARGVRRLVVGGLATDYCVLNTVTDALAEGFDVVVLDDAVRAVDVEPGDGDRAEDAMRRAGARFATVEDLAA